MGRRQQGSSWTCPRPSAAATPAEGVERLPRDLHEATADLAESKVVRELFGDGFVDHFVATREWEWRQAQEAVTDWELARYFEII